MDLKNLDQGHQKQKQNVIFECHFPQFSVVLSCRFQTMRGFLRLLPRQLERMPELGHALTELSCIRTREKLNSRLSGFYRHLFYRYVPSMYQLMSEMIICKNIG